MSLGRGCSSTSSSLLSGARGSPLQCCGRAVRYFPLCQLPLRGDLFKVPSEDLVLELVVKETLDESPSFEKFVTGHCSSTHLQIVHTTESFWIWRSDPLEEDEHEANEDLAAELATAHEDESLSVLWENLEATATFNGRTVRLALQNVTDLVGEFLQLAMACRERVCFLHSNYDSILSDGHDLRVDFPRTTKPYKVVICGQMKCGKSELVNMLLGHLPVCVSAGVGCTSTVWSVKYGEAPCYTLYPSDSEEPERVPLPRATGHGWSGYAMMMRELSTRFRAEGQKSIFAQGYRPKVDVELPLEILKFITIVDMPGVSEFYFGSEVDQAIENGIKEELLDADLVVYVSTCEKSNGFTVRDQQVLVHLRQQVEDADPTRVESFAQKFLFAANRFDLIGDSTIMDESESEYYYDEEDEEDDSEPVPLEPDSDDDPEECEYYSFGVEDGAGIEARAQLNKDILDHLRSCLAQSVFFGEENFDPQDALVVASLKTTDSFYSELAHQFRRRVFQKLFSIVACEASCDCFSLLYRSMGTSFEVSYFNSEESSQAMSLSHSPRSELEIEGLVFGVLARVPLPSLDQLLDEPSTSPIDRFRLLFTRGLQYYMKSQFSESLTDLAEASRLCSDVASVHYHLARVYENLEDWPRATEEFQLATQFGQC